MSTQKDLGPPKEYLYALLAAAGWLAALLLLERLGRLI